MGNLGEPAATADAAAAGGDVLQGDAAETVTTTDVATKDASVAETAPPDTSPADVTADAVDGTADAADAVPETVADSLSDTAPVDAAPAEVAADAVKPIGSCDIDMSDSSPANAEWSQFKVTKGAGPCPPGAICQWTWRLTKGGAIAKSMAGFASTVQMAPADYGVLSNLVSNTGFVGSMMNGWKCDQPPTDVGVSFELTLTGGKHTQDVTGCVIGSMGCNWAKAAYETVAKY